MYMYIKIYNVLHANILYVCVCVYSHLFFFTLPHTHPPLQHWEVRKIKACLPGETQGIEFPLSKVRRHQPQAL